MTEIVLVHRPWSGPSVRALMIVQGIEREAKPAQSKVRVLQPPDDGEPFVLLGHMTHGVGETFLLENGRILDVACGNDSAYESKVRSWLRRIAAL
jgi:hypothetical protein